MARFRKLEELQHSESKIGAYQKQVFSEENCPLGYNAM
jgi:hypothetical protein